MKIKIRIWAEKDWWEEKINWKKKLKFFVHGQGLGFFMWTALISVVISGVTWTLHASRASRSWDSSVTPKTTLATRGRARTKAGKNRARKAAPRSTRVSHQIIARALADWGPPSLGSPWRATGHGSWQQALTKNRIMGRYMIVSVQGHSLLAALGAGTKRAIFPR